MSNASKPVCERPDCICMHRGLSKVEYLCECGDWHPIETHPNAMHFNGKPAHKDDVKTSIAYAPEPK